MTSQAKAMERLSRAEIAQGLIRLIWLGLDEASVRPVCLGSATVSSVPGSHAFARMARSRWRKLEYKS